MRLALLAPVSASTPPKDYGPRETLSSLLCETLVAQGFNVTLFATTDSATQGKLVALVPALQDDMSASNRRLIEAVHISHLSAQAGDFDLIHNLGDGLPLAFAPLIHTPILTTLYVSPPPELLVFLKQSAARHYFVAPSQAARRSELDYHATIYPGIDPSALPFSGTPGSYLVFCGRIHPHENVTTALAIARQVEMPLTIAGPVVDTQYFEQHVAPYVDQQDVRYVGTLDRTACYALLAGAYALLHPSTQPKPFSLTALEAMACGTPVVAWDAGGMSEIVQEGVSGFLVSEVAQAVGRIQQIPELDREACRTHVATHFHLERMVADYVALYEQIVEREKPRAHHASPPWGRWEVLLDEPDYKVKRITVLPDKRLSYQKHFKREEHWTIVRGQALVTLDGHERLLDAGNTIHIPCETAHRIANPGPDNLVFIEVQCGSYFGEDDIVRLQDDYGRAESTSSSV